jgi:phytoene synthase
LKSERGNHQLARDYERCAAITRRSSSNFYYAFMLLSAERRRALNAVYAFCRFVDNIADDEGSREPAAMLDRWRRELDAVYAGTPTHAIARALADSVRRFNLPRRYFDEVIAGVEMDLAHKRYETFEDLRLYCYRVASAVGLICIELFGYRNPRSAIYAENLGIAFQLTNILRDISEDAARDRIYIPLEDLRKFAVTEQQILEGRYSPEFRALMDYEAIRAQTFYSAALDSLPGEDRMSLLSAEAMRMIYRDLLNRIIKADYQVFNHRYRVPAPRKLFLVGRVWLGSHLGFAPI